MCDYTPTWLNALIFNFNNKVTKVIVSFVTECLTLGRRSMKLNNFLRCGYTFTPEEYELETKYVITTTALLIIGFLLAISSFFYYISGDITNATINALGTVFIIVSAYLTRIVGKHNYQELVYIMSMIFTLLILYSYYATPDMQPVSTWIIIQILASFLILDIRLGILITIAYSFFILTMNDILGYHSIQYVLLKITPVIVGLLIIYMIEKKFRTTIVLLEESNKLLEDRVVERTKEIELEKVRLDYQANYDFLTELPNRNKFNHEIKRWIEKYTFDVQEFAVFFIDLDRFKRVNDSLGHNVGDIVLQTIAKRVNKIIPTTAFFSRISGDEFTLLYRYNDLDEVHMMAEELINIIKEPIFLDIQTLYISASIGISYYPKHSVYHADLIKYADISMFEAKKHGRGIYTCYSNEMTNILEEVVLMETELHTALEKEEFILFYQPQIDSRTGDTIGIEALVRWDHPTYGLSSPDTFIPLAEDTGIILILDYYILKLGMNQIVKWKDKGFDIPRISFNFSTKHLQEKDFVLKIKLFLEETNCKAEWIELEITESHVMSNIENAIEILEELKSLGITIAIDDFGVGYSSLSYLKRLPADKLKIDKSFISNLKENDIDKTICRAIINIGNSMGLTVIAEGVETEEQQLFLAQMQCYHIQGHLYHEALSVTQLEQTL